MPYPDETSIGRGPALAIVLFVAIVAAASLASAFGLI